MYMRDFGNKEAETTRVNDWLKTLNHSLTEVWDNEEDAVYDNL